MNGLHGLTEDQAEWLKALLDSRRKQKPGKPFRMPDDIRIALSAKGLIHCARGNDEITLEGIREVARRPLAAEAATAPQNP